MRSNWKIDVLFVNFESGAFLRLSFVLGHLLVKSHFKKYFVFDALVDVPEFLEHVVGKVAHLHFSFSSHFIVSDSQNFFCCEA